MESATNGGKTKLVWKLDLHIFPVLDDEQLQLSVVVISYEPNTDLKSGGPEDTALKTADWIFTHQFLSIMVRSRCRPDQGARCSSVVRVFAHGAMVCRIDPSWWTHWAISRSSQCSTTRVTKAMVCAILSVGRCI